MKNGQDKDANDAVSVKEIKENIKTIATLATWLLGLLIGLLVILASFIFKSYGMPLPEYEGNTFFIISRFIAVILFSFYLTITPVYMWRLIVPNFEKTMGKDLKSCAKVLAELTRHFKMFVFLFLASVPASFIFAFALWYLLT